MNPSDLAAPQPLFTSSIRFLVAVLIFITATCLIPVVTLFPLFIMGLGTDARPTTAEASPLEITACVSATAAVLGILLATFSLRGRRGWFVASVVLLLLAGGVALLLWDMLASSF